MGPRPNGRGVEIRERACAVVAVVVGLGVVVVVLVVLVLVVVVLVVLVGGGSVVVGGSVDVRKLRLSVVCDRTSASAPKIDTVLADV